MEELKQYKNNLEKWFLKRREKDFPKSPDMDYVSIYKTLKKKLKPVHKQVTAGADATDKTSLTWHDGSHIEKVIKQVSKLLLYSDAKVSPYEAFTLLVAIQIHDIKNIEGREEHENRAVSIFSDLQIGGLIDSILLKNINFIISCHSGHVIKDGKKVRDKISLLHTHAFTGDKKIRIRFLAGLLRLADEYADDSARSMNYLLEIGKIKKGSIIHHKHAQSLSDVEIEADSGKVDFDYHLTVEDALMKFPKYIKEEKTFKDVYLLDEIFERTVKSHNETVYCMRYLRPYISVTKINVAIEIEHLEIADQLRISYELEEIGYPSNGLSIFDLCGDQLKQNGGDYWSGENLRNRLKEKKLIV